MSQSPNKRFVLYMIVWVVGVYVLAGISQHIPNRIAALTMMVWMFGFPATVAIRRAIRDIREPM